MDGRGRCRVCGSDELLRADGGVRKHHQLRMRPSGPYRAAFVCDGTGAQPEPAEVAAAAGGA